MNKNELKNGMLFTLRDNKKFYILSNNIYLKNGESTLKFCDTFDVFFRDYSEDLKDIYNNRFDIMKVFDADNNLIWKREEIDWNKIPVDTKVLVRDNDEEEWARKYFAKYKNGKFYCYSSGSTSWSNKHDSAYSYGLIEWKQCKLAEEPKEKQHITYDYIISKHNEYCANHSTCTNCDCSGIDCYETWLTKHFDKIIQEYYSEN